MSVAGNGGAARAAVALCVLFLQGCAAGMAVQAVPAVMGAAAMANADDVSPFRSHVRAPQPDSDTDLAMLDAQIRRAECGDAESQYWLAHRLENTYNATPNTVEIYMWYRLAEIGGMEAATAELAALDARMSNRDVATARRRASDWRPAPESCPPNE